MLIDTKMVLLKTTPYILKLRNISHFSIGFHNQLQNVGEGYFRIVLQLNRGLNLALHFEHSFANYIVIMKALSFIVSCPLHNISQNFYLFLICEVFLILRPTLHRERAVDGVNEGQTPLM